MNTQSKMPATGSLVLDMPDTLREALARIADNRYRRGRNYWHSATAPSLSRDTVARLKARNAVTIPYVDGKARLELTVIGEAIAEAVKRRRAGRTEGGR